MKRSGISWADYSGGDLNVVIRGRNCPVSEGCEHCYVERWYERWGHEMPEGTTVYPDKLGRLWKARWTPDGEPHRRGPGSKPILFLGHYGDLFCEDVREDFILAAFDMMLCRDDADWVVMTKRARRMHSVVEYWLGFNELDRVPPHVWLMVTAENQSRLDERAPWLLRIQAAVRGVSVEPMLEPVDLDGFLLYPPSCLTCGNELSKSWGSPGPVQPCPACEHYGYRFRQKLNWAILGAESGPKRRSFETAWAKDAYEQCRRAGVPFFGKQASGLRPGVPLLLNGREVKEWPQLRRNIMRMR